jgi:hypothetical protein
LIASYTHNFIFLKGRKVGGTSLEIVLSTWCRDRDICSRIPPDDERTREAYGARPRNFSQPDGSIRFFNHMTAEAVRLELPELWGKAFKFTVERHPYEKVISRAWWQLGRRGGPVDELPGEIEEAIERRTYVNHPIYAPCGELLVDEIWRYEEMWDRAGALAERLGMPVPERIPRAKSRHRKDQAPARDILTEEQRKRIYRDARVEFDLLGFEP